MKSVRSYAEQKWSKSVRLRDEGRCLLEEYGTLPLLGWKVCYTQATDAAHIFRRSEAGKLKFSDPVLGVAACRAHHERLHRFDKRVRIPPARVELARAYLDKAHKDGELKVRVKRA